MNSETPLYRLNHKGADHLSVPELMSIVIGMGVNEDKAQYIGNGICEFHDLNSIGSASVAELSKLPGMTVRKASILNATFELSRRHACATYGTRTRISAPQKVFELLHPALKDLKTEHFIALLLDTKNHLLKQLTISTGSINANIVHPREVFRPAILECAAAIIVVHNHPTGDPGPSQCDIDITRKLIDTGKMVGIELYDHVIIGNNKYLSMKEQGLI